MTRRAPGPVIGVDLQGAGRGERSVGQGKYRCLLLFPLPSFHDSRDDRQPATCRVEQLPPFLSTRRTLRYCSYILHEAALWAEDELAHGCN